MFLNVGPDNGRKTDFSMVKVKYASSAIIVLIVALVPSNSSHGACGNKVFKFYFMWPTE